MLLSVSQMKQLSSYPCAMSKRNYNEWFFKSQQEGKRGSKRSLDTVTPGLLEPHGVGGQQQCTACLEERNASEKQG